MLLLIPSLSWGQASATLTGRVVDPEGAAVAGARVALENRVAAFERQTLTDAEGAFTFANVPFQSCSLRVERRASRPTRARSCCAPHPGDARVKLSLAAHAEA